MTHEQAEFERGLTGAADEENVGAFASGGEAVTTLRSYWLHQFCPRCRHTFRLGDTVVIEGRSTVRHAEMRCADAEQESAVSAEVARFFAGVDETWSPPEDVPIVRLDPSHLLLAPPTAGFRRHTCVVCSHTLRLHDHVVICPCGPRDPICSVAVHRDPVHGLHCWDSWTGGRTRAYCPVTSAEAR